MKSKRKKQTWDDIFFEVVTTLFAVALLIIFIYPLYYLVIASLSDVDAVVSGKVRFWVVGFSTESYTKLFQRRDIWLGYRNSLIITVLGTFISIVMTILGAYVLSCREFLPRKLIMKLITFTMFFGGGLIPTFLLVKKLGLYDTMWALLILGAVGPSYIIIARTFFENNIPYELREAAYIDGCSHTKLLFQVIVPLSKAIIAVLVLYYGVGNWNGYFSAMIYLRDDRLIPLQLVLRRILLAAEEFDESGGDISQMIHQLNLAEQLKYSSVIVASIPPLVAYPFIQKYFVKGVMIGSIKG